MKEQQQGDRRETIPDLALWIRNSHARNHGSLGKWFQSIADKTVDAGHLPGGRELSDAGTKELPLAKDSITGYTVVNAESLDDAEKIAKECPYIASTRVYEIMRK